MFYIWDEVSNYDYVFRVDEDVEILDCDPNLFSYMKKKGEVYDRKIYKGNSQID